MTNKVSFFSCLSNVFAFFTQISKKCAISGVSRKNRIICDIDSINMWILADEACRLPIFQILRYNDVILILCKNMISDLKSDYQTSFVC